MATACSATPSVASCAIGGDLPSSTAPTTRTTVSSSHGRKSRPSVISAAEGKRLYVVHADLRQFYDRVRPVLLAEAIDRVRRDDDDPGFFSLVASVLDWGWDSRDERDIRIYTEQAELEDFTRVALPQGLVGSGFFANIVLLPLDNALRTAIGTEIAPEVLLVDSCRYVDDFRILVAVTPNLDGSSNDLEEIVASWLGHLLGEHATGLVVSPKKVQVVTLGGSERLVRQGAKMNRIQSAVSGGFDVLGGEEILDDDSGANAPRRKTVAGDIPRSRMCEMRRSPDFVRPDTEPHSVPSDRYS